MPSKDHFQALLSAEIEQAKHAARVREGRAAVSLSQDFPILPVSDPCASPRRTDEPDDNLTPAQRLAGAEIVGGTTFVAAARAAKVSNRTLYAWRRTPAFRRAVESRSREAIDVVVVRVRNLMLRATRILSDAMVDASPGATAKHAIRVVNSSRLWTILREPAPDDLDDDDDTATRRGGRADRHAVAGFTGGGKCESRPVTRDDPTRTGPLSQPRSPVGMDRT